MSDPVPLVSIFGHVKNASKTIRRCVESVLALDYPNYEFVIQDGASTDGTLQILQEYAQKRPDVIKLVSAPDSCGEEGFFRALQRCQGEFIGSCLADEALLPHAAKWALAAFTRFPAAGAVYGDLYITDALGNITSEFTAPHPFSIEKYLLHEVNPPFAATYFRRAALEAINFRTYPWAFRMGEFELWVRLALDHPVYYVPGRIATYAVHAAQLSAKKDVLIKLLDSRLEYFQRFFAVESNQARFGNIRNQIVGGAHLFVAEVLRDSGTYPAAAELLLKGATYRPTVEMLKRLMLGFYHQGLALEAQQRPAEAIVCYEPLVKLGVEIPQLAELRRQVTSAAPAEPTAPRQISAPAAGARPAAQAAFNRECVVSVIVLCHNYAAHLRTAVASVLAQTYAAYEVIILDDGSTDDSLALAHRLAAEHQATAQIRVFHLDDVGPSAARRFGAAQARGRYFLPLDADDKIAPEFLTQTVPLLEADPKLGFAYVDTVYFGDTAQRCFQPDYDFPRLCTANFISYCSLIRRAAFEAVDGYDRANWGYYEDWDLWLRLGHAGWAGRHVPEPLFYYHQHFGSSLSFYAQRLNPIYNAYVTNQRPELYPAATITTARALLAEMAPGWHARPPLRALGDIQALLAQNPGNRHLLFFLAVARSRQNSTAAAVATLDELLALYPADEQAKRLRAQILTPAPPEPLVSIIVPCYKQAEYLPEAVESVLAQTYRHWEIIIVNDGSPDETRQVAQEIIAQHPERRIRLVDKPNGGLADARNAGIRASQGEFILPLDADDRIHPEMLAKTVQLLKSQPEISIAYTDYVYFGHQNQRLWTTEYNFHTLCNAYNQFTCCALYRRAAWDAVGGYNTNMVYGYEDWDFWIGCGDRGFVGKRIPEVLFFYRTKASSMVSNAHKKHQTLFSRIVLNHPHLYTPQIVAEARGLLEAEGLIARTAPSSGTPKPAPAASSVPPLVSICIPTYNGEEFLAETIACALAQTHGPIEIIVSDDNSSDRTFAIAAEALKQARCPVAIFRHERLGLVGNWNFCVSRARGKYIKFLFQDDLLEPECVAALTAVAEQDPAVGLVFSPRRIELREPTAGINFLAGAQREGADLHKGWSALAALQNGTALLADPKLFQDPINKVGEPTTVLLAKAALDRLGGFDESLKQLVDVEMWLRIMTTYKVGFVDRSLSCFRLHAKQATQANMKAGVIAEDWKRFFRKLAEDAAFIALPANHRAVAAQMLARLGGTTAVQPESSAATDVAHAARGETFKRSVQIVKQLVRETRFAEAMAEAERALKLAPDAAGAKHVTEILAMIRGAMPKDSPVTTVPAAGPNDFFGPAEIKNIEQLVAAFTTDPDTAGVAAKLDALRRSLAAFLCRGEAVQVETLFQGDFGRVYRMLLQAGLPAIDHDREESDSNSAAATNPGQFSWTKLLAQMLLRPAHCQPTPLALEAIPAWFRDDYLAYVLRAPQVFVVPGEAESYRLHMLAWVRSIRNRTRSAPADPLTVNAALYFTLKANFIPLYFTEANTRELSELRAAIMEFVLLRNGADLSGGLPKRRPRREKIKVGFLNAHFSTQTETHVALPGLHLDRSKFELCLFPLLTAGGPLEDYCKSFADQFHPLPTDLAAQVQVLRGAELDVIIIGTNLTAVTNSVALIALHRLAPLQLVSYCCPVSTGMRHIDGYLTGTGVNFPGAAQHFSERLLSCGQPPGCLDYTVEQAATTVPVSRAQLGIADDEVVFINAAACFKILPELQETWAKILKAVPKSRLLLLPFNPNWSNNFPVKQFAGTLRAACQRHGLSADRFTLLPSQPTRADVKELEKVADIYLDTFPFSGSISVIDPLELGIPLVVWEGKTQRSRMAAALLRELEIPELIAADEAGYIAVSVRLATDAAFRRQIRQRVADGMARKPTFVDPAAYGRQLGELLEQLVRGKTAPTHLKALRSPPASQPTALVA